MWKLLGFDLEAQGKDPETTLPTEVGAILVEYREDDGTPSMVERKRAGSLLYALGLGYQPQTREIVELTGITDEELHREGVDPVAYFRDVLFPLMEEADFILAHNKKYDERLFKSFCKRHGLTPPDKVWICSYLDVPYPQKYTCKKLAHLALDHKIKMDHRDLHRATGDVELMLELIALYKFSVILKYFYTPWIFIRVWVPGPWQGKDGDGGVGVAIAKENGYSYQTARGTEEPIFEKSWVKRIKVDQLQKEKDAVNYHVAEVQPKL
jgi:DNA polymerase III epsilon subunit-like protein